MAKKLVIEFDGGGHNNPKQQLYDYEREKYLEIKGIRVKRYWNNLLFQETESVLEDLWNTLHD